MTTMREEYPYLFAIFDKPHHERDEIDWAISKYSDYDMKKGERAAKQLYELRGTNPLVRLEKLVGQDFTGMTLEQALENVAQYIEGRQRFIGDIEKRITISEQRITRLESLSNFLLGDG